MIAPTTELRQRFDALSPDGKDHVQALFKRAIPAIERCGGTPQVWLDAWEVVLDMAETREGDLA